MARLVFRMLVCAGIGALGGLMMWLKGQHIAQSGSDSGQSPQRLGFDDQVDLNARREAEVARGARG